MSRLVGGRYLLVETSEASRPGGLSVVRKAVDENGRFVAIKVTAASDAVARKVYKRELEALRLLDHPNVIRLHDAGTDPVHGPFLVLDWVDWTLHDALRQRGTFPWDEVLDRFAIPLAGALSHAHLKLVEHRDIKPKNVLIRDDLSPVLADFGIGKTKIRDTTDGTVEQFRSGIYAPPELEAPVAYVRDVYALGVLLLQVVYDQPLRDYQDLDVALGSAPLPVSARQLLERCVHADPTVRPANGSVLLEALTALAAGERRASAVERPVVRLRLRDGARNSFSEGAEVASVEALVASDLLGDVFAEFGWDSARNVHDPNVVVLYGNAWRYRAKPDFSAAELVVTAATNPEFEQLERGRSRAMAVNGLTWTATARAGPDQAKRGLEVLLRGLEEFYDRRAESAGEGSGPDDDVLERWIRVLAAREDLARGERQPLSFEGLHERGREVRVTLVAEPDGDLLGTEWEIRARGWRYPIARGLVIRHRGRELTLSVRGSRTLPEQGTLFPHIGPEQVALQRQHDAVSAIREGTAAHPALHRLLVDPSTARGPLDVVVEEWQGALDEDKRNAVRAALGAEDVLVVKGPPGTGKTSFITELVAQYLGANPDARVLIVSQTHIAVDNALERLEAARIDGLVRLGSPEDPRVVRSVRHLLLDQRMSAWAAAVRRRAEEHMGLRAKEIGVAPNELRGALALKELVALLRERAAVEREIAGRSPDSDTSGLARGLGIEVDESELQQRMDDIATRQAELIDNARTELGSLLTLSDDLSEAEADAAVSAVLGSARHGTQVLRLLELQAEFLQRIASDQHLASAYLQTTRVVAGTCIGFLRHRAVRTLDFDLCVLDEASKATATEALVPLARARRSVLVGDTNQLPPSDEDLLRRRDILAEHSLEPGDVTETLFQRLVDRLPPSCVHSLQEQYRMIRPIGDLVSSCFYDGALRSPRKDGLPGYDRLGKPVLWLDTSTLGDRRRETVVAVGTGSEAKSCANRAEAKVVIDRLRVLDRAVSNRVLEPRKGEDAIDVLLITAYRAQVDEIRRHLARQKWVHVRPQVHTVDAVQGRETDIAIFSVTRSNPQKTIGFLGMEYWRRINVALSRARFGLTIVGDAGFCASTPGALHQVLEYMRSWPQDCEIRTVDGAG